jgi:hypothetical protein
MSIVRKETHGYDGVVRLHQGTVTDSNLNAGDNEDSNPRGAAQEPSIPALEAERRRPEGATKDLGGGISTGSVIGIERAKPVDFRTVEGSYPGDHRAQPGDVAKAALDKASDQGGPRRQAGQFPLSGKQGPTPPTPSFVGVEDLEHS